MAQPVPIVFFHTGRLPPFLYKTIESARFFNPDSPIYLLTDQTELARDDLGITVGAVGKLRSSRLAELDRHYVAVSPFKPKYIRITIERWFYVDELLQREGLDRAVYLDSDGMLFHDVRDSFALLDPSACMLTSNIEGPALTYINGTLAPFLDLIIARYQDSAFLESYRVRAHEALARGALVNLDDMTLLQEFWKEGDGNLQSYPNHLPIGYIDHCIYSEHRHWDDVRNVPNRRHGHRKCVYWEDDDGVFRPSVRRESDGSTLPLLFLHFQNGAKRRICRFNRVGRDSPLPRPLRLAYYNHLLN